MATPSDDETNNGGGGSSVVKSVADGIIADFEEETRHAAEIQARVLREILERNAGTEYLRRFDDGSASADAASFKRRLPIVTHSDLKPYFDRIADGDTSPILTAEPIRTLSLSSGTTSDGQQKYLTLYKEILDASIKLARISGAFRSKAYPIRPGKRLLDLVFSGKLSVTAGGVKTGTATTHLFRSEEFKQKYKTADVRPCTPSDVVLAADNRQALYCHLLCSLVYRDDIEFIHSTFAFTIVEAFKTLQSQWPDLCRDLRSGSLSPYVTEDSVRHVISDSVLTEPLPDLAGTVEEICRFLDATGWAAAVPQIWPNCKYVLSIMTGSMEAYLKKLQHYAGNLPLVTTDYGATETWVGANTNPKAAPRETTFTVVPSFAYFEFLPLEEQTAADGTDAAVGLTELEVGREYEVIVTTYGGLYRYRLGDVVKVAGFYNQSPKLSFMCRKNVVLNLHVDKNTEKDIQMAVECGMAKLQEEDPAAELVDFTTYASRETDPGHYVVFVELMRPPRGRREANGEGEDGRIGEESVALLALLATAIDEAFNEPGYVTSRKSQTIGPLELCLLRPGTFRSLLERFLTRGAAITQYKTPRCVPSPELRRILHAGVLVSVHSSAYAAAL